MSQALRTGAEAPVPVSFEGWAGVTIRGDAWGDPGARPVVLLHGGGQTRHAWARCGQRLAQEGWRALALDLRGHGESDWCPEARYAPSDFVQDLLAVARALDAAPVLVGASLGGMTALLAEGESPEPLAAALVLVDVTPRLEVEGTARIVDFMLARPDGFASLEEAADAVAGYRRQRGRPADVSGLRKNLRQGPDGRWRWHWDPRFVDRRRIDAVGGSRGAARSTFNDAERMLAAARALDVPTLLVRGRESDVVSPEGAQEFLAAAPHARFADVSGAGHMVAGDRNDAFNEAVLAFLREALP